MSRTLAIYYEHPDATQHAYDPCENESPYAVVFNRDALRCNRNRSQVRQHMQ